MADRLDLESDDFHKDVYNGYMTICEKYAERITKIDASKTIDEVVAQVINVIKSNYEEYIERINRFFII